MRAIPLTSSSMAMALLADWSAFSHCQSDTASPPPSGESIHTSKAHSRCRDVSALARQPSRNTRMEAHANKLWFCNVGQSGALKIGCLRGPHISRLESDTSEAHEMRAMCVYWSVYVIFMIIVISIIISVLNKAQCPLFNISIVPTPGRN